MTTAPTIRDVTILYTNHKGIKADRRITPMHIWYGFTKHHPQPQWLLHAYCHEKQALRDFALRDVHEWRGSSRIVAS